MDYRVRRQGDVDLVFDGDLLADETSKSTQPRWTEIRIYRTTTGKYVAEMIGRSVVRGEIDRITVKVCVTPQEVREALRRTADSPYLTDLAIDALTAAAQHDPAFLDVVEDRI